jgi:hypothetical protein
LTKSHSYKIGDTTKVQREKLANEAIGFVALAGIEPSAEAKALMLKYINGECEAEEAVQIILARYKGNE